MGRRVERVMVERLDAQHSQRRPTDVLVEEPLQIRLDGQLVATTMRTPGNDFELAVGFCHAEGWLAGATIATVRYCGTGEAADTEFNVVTVETTGRTVEPTPRLGITTSSCGWCGSDSIDALADRLQPLTPQDLRDDVRVALDAAIRPGQFLFDKTGGSHAAAAFDRVTGEPLVVREDIGRHNALDAVIGRLRLDDRLPGTELGVWISGRASFEMVQKAWSAGIPTLVSVSAASSLAVETARRGGITMYGFARGVSATRFA